MSKYQSRDLIVTLPAYGENVYEIIEADNKEYRVKSIKNNKHYLIKEAQIAAKIGVAELKKPEEEKDVFSYAVEKAKNCQGESKERWEMLALLKPGDTIKVTHRLTIYEAEFCKINLKKPKLVFSAKVLGKQMAFPLESLWLNK